jgi:hypothetical protein
VDHYNRIVEMMRTIGGQKYFDSEYGKRRHRLRDSVWLRIVQLSQVHQRSGTNSYLRSINGIRRRLFFQAEHLLALYSRVFRCCHNVSIKCYCFTVRGSSAWACCGHSSNSEKGMSKATPGMNRLLRHSSPVPCRLNSAGRQ